MASKKNILVLTISLLLIAMLTGPLAGEEIKLKVTPQAAGVNVPTHTPIKLTGDLAKADPQNITVTLKQADGKPVAGQIVSAEDGKQLWWIIPSTQAGKTTAWTATLTAGKAKINAIKQTR